MSNHGGRTLDTLPATSKLCPRSPRRLTLLLDGGVRRDTDVFKALALGARAALIGWPYLYPLAAAGHLSGARMSFASCATSWRPPWP